MIALASASVMSVALIANAPKIEEFNVSADATLEVNAEKLSSTVLEDFVVPDNRDAPAVNKTDKKFKIELDDGKYILGALLFGDCSHQFVGSTLGDAFGLDNLKIVSGNAINFHLILSFEHVTSVTVNYNIGLEQKDVVSDESQEHPLFGTKYKTLNPRPTTDDEFYNIITTAGYSKILDNKPSHEEGEKYYDDVIRSSSSADYRKPGETGPASHTQSLSAGPNLLVIQFGSNKLIEKNRKLSFTLTHFFFNHSCD